MANTNCSFFFCFSVTLCHGLQPTEAGSQVLQNKNHTWTNCKYDICRSSLIWNGAEGIVRTNEQFCYVHWNIIPTHSGWYSGIHVKGNRLGPTCLGLHCWKPFKRNDFKSLVEAQDKHIPSSASIQQVYNARKKNKLWGGHWGRKQDAPFDPADHALRRKRPCELSWCQDSRMNLDGSISPYLRDDHPFSALLLDFMQNPLQDRKQKVQRKKLVMPKMSLGQ